jgi:hypothetical protein
LIFGKKEVPVENKVYNPANARIGNSFTLDVMGLRDMVFTLREICEYKRQGKPSFVDYVLLSRPVGGEDKWIRLRYMPVEVPDSVLKDSVLMLVSDGEGAFDKDLDEVLRRNDPDFTITDNATNDKQTFWRPSLDGKNHITGSHCASLSVVRDANGDGKVEESEIDRRQIEYWDYSRITHDEAKQEITEFLFIELDKHCGTQAFWRGEEIDSQRVMVL